MWYQVVTLSICFHMVWFLEHNFSSFWNFKLKFYMLCHYPDAWRYSWLQVKICIFALKARGVLSLPASICQFIGVSMHMGYLVSKKYFSSVWISSSGVQFSSCVITWLYTDSPLQDCNSPMYIDHIKQYHSFKHGYSNDKSTWWVPSLFCVSFLISFFLK